MINRYNRYDRTELSVLWGARTSKQSNINHACEFEKCHSDLLKAYQGSTCQKWIDLGKYELSQIFTEHGSLKNLFSDGIGTRDFNEKEKVNAGSIGITYKENEMAKE